MRVATCSQAIFRWAFGVGIGLALTGVVAMAQTPATPAADPATATVAPSVSTKDSARARKPAPLEGMAAKSVLMLPTRYVSFADTLGWAKQLPTQGDWLAQLDSALVSTLRDRGLQTWRLADDITRSAKRNADFVADPHNVAAIALRFGHKPPRYEIGEPLASQLRSLIALNDARVVLIPVEVRTVNRGKQGALLLRLAAIDARSSTVIWTGDVAGTPVSAWSNAVFADLAEQVASLVVPAN